MSNEQLDPTIQAMTHEDAEATIKVVQNFDVFEHVENARSGTPEADMALLRLSATKSRLLSQLYDKVGDTKFSSRMDDYLAVLLRNGFQIGLQASFEGHDRHSEPSNRIKWEETLYVLYRQDGFVLTAESYSPLDRDGTRYIASGETEPEPPHRNGSHLYYVLKPKNAKFDYPSVRASGGWESPSHPGWRNDRNVPDFPKVPKDAVFIGDCDAREGVMQLVKGLTREYDPLSPWPEIARMPKRGFRLRRMLMTWMDWKEWDTRTYGVNGADARLEQVVMPRVRERWDACSPELKAIMGDFSLQLSTPEH